MALTTYNELLTAIQDYQDDTGTTITDRQADWVVFAEQRMHYGAGVRGSPFYSPPLRVRAMEATAIMPLQACSDGGTSAGSANAQTVTLSAAPTAARGLTFKFVAGYSNTGAMTMNPNSVGAVAVKKGSSRVDLEADDITAGATYAVFHDGTYYVLLPSPGAVPLPPRYLGMRSLYVQSTKFRPLEFMSGVQFNGMEAANTSGLPRAYTLEGDCIRLGPRTDTSYPLICNYYRRFAALSTALNDVYRNSPNVYLYGALLEACLYLGDAENAMKWHGLFMSGCQGLVSSDQRDRYGSAPLQMRTDITP